MNPVGQRCGGWLACLGLAAAVLSAQANADLGPYEVIVKKNIFGLNPPPPPQTNAPPPPPVTTDITLTGITTLDGVPRAHLMAKDPSGKLEPLNLEVGARSGGLQVLDIDEVARTVKVRNGMREVVLNFKDHGAKASAAPAPPAPGQPGGPGGPPRPPGSPPIIAPGANQPTTSMISPGATTLPAGSPANVTLGANPVAGTSGTGTLLREMPTRSVRGSYQPQTTTVPHPPQANLTAEQSAVIMAVTKEVNAAEIQKGNFPPLPPIPGVDQD